MRFNSQRYLTKGVQADIPFVLQLFLWKLIVDLPEPKDYLQVFNLSECNGNQHIVHEQEEPEYRQEYQVISDNPVTAKVFVIDDEIHCTMLLAEEY